MRLRNIFKEPMQTEKSRVCLTTKTWTSYNDIVNIPHFINTEWRLHKKSISYEIILIRARKENLVELLVFA